MVKLGEGRLAAAVFCVAIAGVVVTRWFEVIGGR
jgi:hypothetical protein